MTIQFRAVVITLTIAFACVGASCSDRSHSSRRMADGKYWTTDNLNVNTDPSFCFDDAEANCRRDGRLYTWESAQRACQSLRDGWRLPTNDEWRQLAKAYGGVRDDSDDSGGAAFKALLIQVILPLDPIKPVINGVEGLV